jgi:transposase-like protein
MAARSSSPWLTGTGSRRSRGRTCCATAPAAACAPRPGRRDGALGFWGALREVFPETREQRCWFRKAANVLAALPKSAHPGAKKALAEIWGAEDKPHALAAVKAFDAAYGAKFPTAAAKITDDAEELLAFFDYPCEHWVHLRTTNPIWVNRPWEARLADAA